MELHSISDYVNVCVGMSARTGDSTKKTRHNQMAESSNANSTLGDAGRKQSPVSGVSGLASSTVRGGGGGGGVVGPFRRISEELDEAQGWHTQCEHPEGKGMRDSGNAISKKN